MPLCRTARKPSLRAALYAESCGKPQRTPHRCIRHFAGCPSATPFAGPLCIAPWRLDEPPPRRLSSSRASFRRRLPRWSRYRVGRRARTARSQVPARAMTSAGRFPSPRAGLPARTGPHRAPTSTSSRPTTARGLASKTARFAATPTTNNGLGATPPTRTSSGTTATSAVRTAATAGHQSRPFVSLAVVAASTLLTHTARLSPSRPSARPGFLAPTGNQNLGTNLPSTAPFTTTDDPTTDDPTTGGISAFFGTHGALASLLAALSVARPLVLDVVSAAANTATYRGSHCVSDPCCSAMPCLGLSSVQTSTGLRPASGLRRPSSKGRGPRPSPMQTWRSSMARSWAAPSAPPSS